MYVKVRSRIKAIFQRLEKDIIGRVVVFVFIVQCNPFIATNVQFCMIIQLIMKFNLCIAMLNNFSLFYFLLQKLLVIKNLNKRKIKPGHFNESTVSKFNLQPFPAFEIKHRFR